MSPNPTAKALAAAALLAIRRRGIVVQLVAALGLVAMVPLSITSWRLIQLNKEAMTTAHQENQMREATSLARAIDLQVEGLRSDVLHVAMTLSLALGGGGAEEPEEVQRVLEEAVHERMPALRLSRFHASRVESVEAGSMPEELKPHFDQILTQAIEFHSAVRVQSWSHVMKPLHLPDGGTAVVIAAPVVSFGSLRGVLWGLVDLDQVWHVARGSNPSPYLTFAVDEDGVLFATSNRNVLDAGSDVEQSPLVQRFLRKRKAFDERVTELFHRVDGVERSRQGDMAQETMPFKLEEGGRERDYMGTFSVTEQGWGVLVQAPLDEMLVTISDVRRSTVRLAFIVLCLAALVAIALARTLSGPIRQLAAASRTFATGAFSTRVEVRSRNEIGELARTFNHMAGELERYFEENKQLFFGTIRAMAQAVDAKDPYTRGHSDRVTKYAVILAEQLGIKNQPLEDIHIAAQLHDVGKIGIDDAILQKPGALTDAEFAIMKTHTTKGAEIMQQIPQMKRIIPGLRWHHERADGRGYPDGLKGDKIPRMARIIAVADTFDAITTRRPYQAPMTYEKARARINELRGIALDAEVVDAFNRACDTGLIRIDPSASVPAPKVLVAAS